MNPIQCSIDLIRLTKLTPKIYLLDKNVVRALRIGKKNWGKKSVYTNLGHINH